jgi:hypothetical protein
MPIPDADTALRWHGTLPVDSETDEIGIVFWLDDDRVIRLRLPVSDARNLAESLAEYLQETPQQGAETQFSDQVLSELSAIRRELRLVCR